MSVERSFYYDICHLPRSILQDGPTKTGFQTQNRSLQIQFSSLIIRPWCITLYTFYIYIFIYSISRMNQEAANRSQVPQHDASRKSESWDGRRSCSSKQKFPTLMMTKSFLPRAISPTKKEADALQLAWEILNDKVSFQCFHRVEASSNRDHQNDNTHTEDEATETTDHSSSSLS